MEMPERPADELYRRARAILDEIGVPDSGEVAERLEITLEEADRLVSRWERGGEAEGVDEPVAPAAPAQAAAAVKVQDASPVPERKKTDWGEWFGCGCMIIVLVVFVGGFILQSIPESWWKDPPSPPRVYTVAETQALVEGAKADLDACLAMGSNPRAAMYVLMRESENIDFDVILQLLDARETGNFAALDYYEAEWGVEEAGKLAAAARAIGAKP